LKPSVLTPTAAISLKDELAAATPTAGIAGWGVIPCAPECGRHLAARGKNPENGLVAKAAENRRPRGRPRKLSAAAADALVARIAAGDSLATAARAAGVAPRTLRTWRRRAWSTRREDRDYVALERRVWAAQLAATRQLRPPPEPWEEVAARLELEFPDRWRLDPVLDDFFDEPSAA
jgi:hypothetical protein